MFKSKTNTVELESLGPVKHKFGRGHPAHHSYSLTVVDFFVPEERWFSKIAYFFLKGVKSQEMHTFNFPYIIMIHVAVFWNIDDGQNPNRIGSLGHTEEQQHNYNYIATLLIDFDVDII